MNKFHFLFAALICTCVLFFSQESKAQIGVNLQGTASVPLGDFGDGTKMGLGFQVSGHYFLTPKLSVGLGLQRTSYKPKEEIAGFDISLAITAFTANVHYYFTEEGFRPYVGLDLGNYSASSKIGSTSVSENYLGLAPTLGVLYGVTDNITSTSM